MHPSGSVLQIESYKISSETLCRSLHDKVFFVSHHTGPFLYSIIGQCRHAIIKISVGELTACNHCTAG